MQASTGTYYHFTSWDSLKPIIKSDKLKMSKVSNGTAYYGDGVYFTCMNPFEKDYTSILINNWGSRPSKWIDVCLEFEIPTYKMKNVGYKDNRNVHIFRDEDLDNLGRHLTGIYCLQTALQEIAKVILKARPSYFHKQVCSCDLSGGKWIRTACIAKNTASRQLNNDVDAPSQVTRLRSRRQFDNAICGDSLVVVEFFRPGCGACEKMAPQMDSVTRSCAGVEFYSINTSQPLENDIADEHDVTAVPTFVLFRSGDEVGRVVGADKNGLVKLVKYHESCAAFTGNDDGDCGHCGSSLCFGTNPAPGYRGGFVCNLCSRSGLSCASRWVCVPHKWDVCMSCLKRCGRCAGLLVYGINPNYMAGSYYNCDCCGAAGLSVWSKRWLCVDCRFDVCPTCAH